MLFLLIVIFLILSTTGVGAPIQSVNNDLVIIQNNSLMAISQPSYFSLEEKRREEVIELLLEEIARRESGGNPDICNIDDCKYGRGLYQIVSGTEKLCEKELGKEIDPFNPIEAEECAVWLLDTQGIWPWEPYSGSYVFLLKELDLYNEMYLRTKL